MDNIIVHKKKRFFNKLKQNTERFLIFVFMLIGLLATLNFAINTAKDWGEWYFHERLELRHTLVSAGVSAEAEEASLVNTEREVESTLSPLSLEEVLDKIYQLESSSGVNDTCHPNGHNGYGFGQHKTNNLCFGSDEEARNAVSAWFQEKLQTYTLEESLRIYRCGNTACGEDYVEKFNAIKI